MKLGETFNFAGSGVGKHSSWPHELYERHVGGRCRTNMTGRPSLNTPLCQGPTRQSPNKAQKLPRNGSSYGFRSRDPSSSQFDLISCGSCRSSPVKEHPQVLPLPSPTGLPSVRMRNVRPQHPGNHDRSFSNSNSPDHMLSTNLGCHRHRVGERQSNLPQRTVKHRVSPSLTEENGSTCYTTNPTVMHLYKARDGTTKQFPKRKEVKRKEKDKG